MLNMDYIKVESVTRTDGESGAFEDPRDGIDDGGVFGWGEVFDGIAEDVEDGGVIHDFGVDFGIVSHVGQDIGEEIGSSIDDIAIVIVVHIVHVEHAYYPLYMEL